MLENLRKYKILLASKSPRRHELLSHLRIPFNTVIIRGIDESYPDDMPVLDIPEYLSQKKADAYLASFNSNEMIITADTLVICDGKVMGKPHDHKEAYEMINALSGNTHQVITGVCISTKEKKVAFSDKTDVKFCEMTKEEIDYYINNFRPFDKAGAYGIQEWIGCVAVESIEGSYYNVMGLPVHRLYEELKKF